MKLNCAIQSQNNVKRIAQDASNPVHQHIAFSLFTFMNQKKALILHGALEQIYGSPQVIKLAILKRLQEFLRLTNRGNQKFQELRDLLELEG